MRWSSLTLCWWKTWPTAADDNATAAATVADDDFNAAVADDIDNNDADDATADDVDDNATDDDDD